MELKEAAAMIRIKEKLQKLGKLKYALLLAAIGVFILLLPVKTEGSQVSSAPVVQVESDQIDIELKMESILSQVDGAGDVRVMLTVRNEGSVEYQTDQEKKTDGDREELRTETVFGEQSALIRRKTSPEYLGAIIVAQGGGRPEVCLELVRAMCSLTGLTSDKITVLKMKDQ